MKRRGSLLEQWRSDVAARRHVGGGGERDGLHVAEAAAHLAEHRVFGPEIVAPLRDAMGLVDGEQVNAGAGEPLGRAGIGEPLRRGIEQAHAPIAHGIDHAAVLVLIVRGVEASRLDPEMAQRRHLVAHEGDQRRDHEGQALAGERRQLVAEGFAGAGRHDGENVLAGQHGAHDLLLSFAEGGEAEDVVENLARGSITSAVWPRPDSGQCGIGNPERRRTPFAAAMPVAKVACSR